MMSLATATPEMPGPLPGLERADVERPLVEMADIFAVQALAMGYIRRRARTRRSDHDAKRHGFAMLETDAETEANSGSGHNFLSCTVRKINFDQWRMRISFTEAVNAAEAKQTYMRELYSFDWLRDGNRQAWHSTTHVQRVGDATHEILADRSPLTPLECIVLQERMRDMSERVNPLLPDSIYRPQ